MTTLTDSLHHFECKQSDDEVKTDLELTCTECGTVVCDIEDGDNLKVLVSVADAHICPEEGDVEQTHVCRHCGHGIALVKDTWVAPDAGFDMDGDGIWRETCPDNHEDRIAAHEPEEN